MHKVNSYFSKLLKKYSKIIAILTILKKLSQNTILFSLIEIIVQKNMLPL